MKRIDDIKCIVFDMDGIIFDTERLYIECWKDIARKYDLKNVDEVCKQCIGTTEEVTKQIVLDNYGELFPYDEYRIDVVGRFKEKIKSGIPVKKGVRELLSYLKEYGVRIAIASSTKTDTIKMELTATELISYFDEIIGGDQVENSKPAPDSFLKACKALGTEPSVTYGIEDSYNGVRALSKAGMKPIMVPDLLEPTDEMRGLVETIKDDLLMVKAYFEEEI